ncbi:MAG: Nramp family divalent metal transporter [Syntrophothermus sp.]
MKNLKKKNWVANLLVFLSILGPGIITGSVDNDAGGITTYSVAGALYGYKLLWTLIPAFLVLFVVQEMNARMGIVTGKGLADLIRESFGVKATFFIFLGLIFADIGNTTSEFAGVAGSLQIFGVSKYFSVPVVAALVWIFVVNGSYKSAEKLFLIFSVFLLTYVVSAIMAKPDWTAIGNSIIKPSFENDSAFITMTIGIIGTTIAPWMQFYMQSAVIEKGITLKEYKYELWDVFIGCVATIVVAFFIIVACGSTLHANHVQINDAKDAALALQPLAGAFASYLFAFGLFIASIFAAAILPLAASFYICQAFGFEAGIDKKLREAPEFYTIFTAILIISVAIILIPGAPLIQITVWTQVLNGILLPVVLVSMMVIINKAEVMGGYVNKGIKNFIGWTTITILVILTMVLTYKNILG